MDEPDPTTLLRILRERVGNISEVGLAVTVWDRCGQAQNLVEFVIGQRERHEGCAPCVYQMIWKLYQMIHLGEDEKGVDNIHTPRWSKWTKNWSKWTTRAPLDNRRPHGVEQEHH